MFHATRFALLAIAIIYTAPIAAAEPDWPQWRGPRLDFVSVESDFVTDWPEQGPPIRWKTNVGMGYSSVSVVGDQLWTMGHRDGKETVYCLAIKTGDAIWSHSYAGELVDNLHKGGPGSTPTIDGDRVYSLGKQGQLFCLAKKDGDVIWKFDAPATLGVKVPEWGFTGSPLILGDRVILDLGRIVAVDKMNGKVLWKGRLAPAGYGSATPMLFAGRPAIAVLNNEGLNVLRVDDGEELAFHEWETSYATNATSPLVIDNRHLFLSTGYQRGCALLEIVDDELKIVYESKSLSNHMSNSIVLEEHIYGFDGNAHRGRAARFVCIDLATGVERWKQLGLGCGSLMLAGGNLVILTEEGELVIAKANPDTFSEVARAQVIDGRCWTVPVLSAGQIYCRNDVGDVVCVDVRHASQSP